jgi:biopolymer transport protein ExbD
VDLPSSQQAEEKPGKDVNIIVEADGTIEVSGVKVANMEDMAKEIKRVMQAEITKNAVLQAHPKILHRTVIRIMDTARGQGIEAIAFATEEQAAPATEAE